MANVLTIPFGNINSEEFRIMVLPTDTDYNIYLQPSVDPCVVNYDALDDKFGSVIGSECQFRFVNPNYDLSDHFVVDPIGTKVLVQRWYNYELYDVWTGFLNTETYSEDYSRDERLVQLVANDGLGAASRMSYFTGDQVDDEGFVKDPLSLGTIKIKDLFLECLDHMDFDQINTKIDIRGENDDFLSLSVELSNFVDEDNNGNTRREILDYICRSFSVNLYFFGGSIWLIDTSYVGSPLYVLYQKYDNQFNLISDQQLTVIDLSSSQFVDDFEMDGSQTLDFKGGYSKILTTYSPYPTVGKISSCSDLDDLVILDPEHSWYVYTPWVSRYFTFENPVFQYVRPVSLDDESVDKIRIDYDDSDTFKKQSFCASQSFPDKLDSSGRHIGVFLRSTESNPQHPNSNTSYGATIKGGIIPKTTDVISVVMDSYFSWDYDSNPDTIEGTNKNRIRTSRLRVGFIIRCGDKYATGGYSFSEIPSNTSTEKNTITFDSDVEGIVWLDINNTEDESATLINELSFDIDGNPELGSFEMKLVQNHVILNYDGAGGWNNPRTIPYAWAFGVRDPSISINGYAYDDDDVEEFGSTNILFKDKKNVDLTISSKRDNGCLDRGCLINSLGEHESTFYRYSSGQNTNMAGCVIQGYIGNYREKYKQLNATMYVPQVLRKFPPLVDPYKVVAIGADADETALNVKNLLLTDPDLAPYFGEVGSGSDGEVLVYQEGAGFATVLICTAPNEAFSNIAYSSSEITSGIYVNNTTWQINFGSVEPSNNPDIGDTIELIMTPASGGDSIEIRIAFGEDQSQVEIPDDALNPSYIMTPISVIKDSNGGITNNMILNQGSFNIQTNEVSGSWVELFDANVTLT